MQNPVKRGVFIVIEGIDGSGTTTQCERYAAHLRARGMAVHVTREPSVGPIGSLIRLILTHRLSLPEGRRSETMALLFAADRLDHVASEIEPRLQSGHVVISDRYDLSSLAYQSMTASPAASIAASAEWIRTLNRHARRPDVTLVVDVSPEVAAQRRLARGAVAEIFDEAGIQARLAAAYRRAEAFVPGDRVIHVDGDPDVATVAQAIAGALDPIVSASRTA